MKREDRKLCPVCEKLMWYNYCKLKWECPISKEGCGYPNTNRNLKIDKSNVKNKLFRNQNKIKKYECPKCRSKNYPTITIGDRISLSCKKCCKSYTIIQKRLQLKEEK